MSALKPDAVDTHELGTSALPWKNLHIDAVTIGARSTGANVPTGSEVVIGSNEKLTADPSVPVDVEIYGSLTVHGNTTTISSTTLTISDREIIVAQGAANSVDANGAGLRVNASGDTLGAADATLLYDDTGTQWEFNKNVETAGSLLPEGVGKASFNLGSTSQPWNDLFLSNGGVISFANTQDPIDGSDLTLAHSADLLTISGGNTRVDRLEIDSANDYIDVDTDLTLTASAGITLDAVADIVLDADGDDITFKAGTGDSIGLKWSQSNSGDWTNLVGAQDKDLIFQVNDGGVVTEVMKLVGESSSLQIDEALKLEFRDAGIFAHSNADGQFTLSSDGNTADAINIVTSDAAGGIDIDAGTSGIAIGTTGAYIITAAGNSTISTTGTGTLTIDSGGALVIDTDGTDSISLGIEAAAKTITIGNDASTKVDVNALSIELDSAGSIVLDSATTTGIDSTGNLSINSAAEINIGNAVVAQPINVGTGASARTITVGNNVSTKVDINALAIELDAGTSGFTIDGAAASSVSTSAGALTVNGSVGLNLQEDGENVIAIDTDRDVLFSQTGGATDDPDVEFDGYVRFDGSSEFDGAVQVDGNLTANNPVSVQSTLTVGEDDTGYDVKLFGATSGQYLLWDQDRDELVLAGDTKLSFHDDSSTGGENIVASADGHLEVNAGVTLDMTAPTVDINASTAVTVESATFTLGSVDVSTDLNPTLTIQHTGNNANGGTLKFVKDKGAAGAQGDDAGVIQFFADNAVQAQTEFARVTAEVQTATNGEEGGKLSLSVAEHDGTMTAGLVLTEGSTDGVVDVSIGAGLGSTTTIAGNLTVNGTTTTVSSTELTVADDLITVSKGNDTVANADGSGLEIDVTSGTNLHWKYVHARTALSANTDIDVDTGKVFRINGTEVLSAAGTAKVQSGVAGAGLSHSDGVLALDIDELAALGSSLVHQTEDHFVFSDNGTEKKITFENLQGAVLASGAVAHAALAEDIISGQAELAHANIADADDLMIHDADAAVVKKVGVDSLRDHFFGAVSGDITVADGGEATIQANAVQGSMLNNDVVSGQAEHTGTIDDADEFLISDAGTIKRTDFSVLRDAVFADVSGDATVAAGGALTIAAGAVENSMLVNDHITVVCDSGSQDIHLNDTLTISGTEGEIETSVTGDTITIGLPDNVDIDDTLTVAGSTTLNDNFAVGGAFNTEEATFQVQASNGNTLIKGGLTIQDTLSASAGQLSVKDSLIILSSDRRGNVDNVDVGILGGMAINNYVGFFYDNNRDLWTLRESLSGETSADSNVVSLTDSVLSTFEAGQIYLNDAAEDGGSGVATPLTTHATYYATAAAETSTLAAGTEGQIKVLAMKTNGGNMVVTVTNAAWGGSSELTLSEQGAACTLQYIDSQWYVIGSSPSGVATA